MLSDSLIPQGLGRVYSRCFDGLDAYRHPRNDQGCKKGKDEHSPIKLYMIGKSGKPAVHAVPGERKGYDHGDQDRLSEATRQQVYDTRHTRTQHLANTDLFGATFREESR